MNRACVVAFLVALLAAPAGAEERVDHSGWTKLLEKHVTGGAVDYKAWKTDTAALDAYLAQLAAVKDEATLPKPERLALWINAYNAITVRAILDFYPLRSIREKHSTIFGWDIWKDYKKTIAGTTVSLDEIENDRLRQWGEPRIHFAINCASRGCPELRREAYDGARLDAQLEDQVRRFLASPDKLRIDGNTVHLSAIFKWFGDDFGSSRAERLRWLAAHETDEARKRVLLDPDARLEFLDYDWSLNERAP